MTVYYESDIVKVSELSERMLGGKSGVILHKCLTPCVATGALDTLDRRQCAMEGLPVGRFRYIAGSIVCFPGDISVCATERGRTSLGRDLIADFARFLSKRGLNPTMDNNDVMVNGKKVASWGRFSTKNGMCQNDAHFSFRSDEEMIRRVCTKRMEKEPGSLEECGITAQELAEFVEKWISSYVKGLRKE